MLKALFACVGIFAGAAAAASEPVEHNGTAYRTYVATPEQIELLWADDKGVPFRQFRTAQSALLAEGKAIKFMMNGGIFEPGGIPSGLLVVNNKVLRPLNTSEGQGNFYLKPNGVFYIEREGAKVVPTDQYGTVKATPRIAIQSGPLLLHQNQIHPSFRRQSINYLHRNGVGVRKDGKVVFAITVFGQSRYPNLYEFAELFRSQGCEEALFLDGDLSQMVIDPIRPIPSGNHFGAIFAITTSTQQR